MNIYRNLAGRAFMVFIVTALFTCHEATFPEGSGSEYEVILQGIYEPINWSKVYYSFSKGEQVDESKSATTEWDIMFRGAYGYTNSGSTASDEEGFGEHSHGNGGWYFTGRSGLDALSELKLSDLPAPGEFDVDYKAWISEMSGAVEQNCNGMMLLTTTNGSGTEEDPYEYSMEILGDPSDDEAIFMIEDMPPDFITTERIYIIKCADGNSYGAIMFGDVSQGFGCKCEYYTTIYCKYLGSL